MSIFSFLRIKKNTQRRNPPQGYVDLVYNPATGQLAVREADGSVSPLGGGVVNLSLGAGEPEVVIIDNDSGDGVEIPAATDETAGVMSAADKVLLDTATSDNTAESLALRDDYGALRAESFWMPGVDGGTEMRSGDSLVEFFWNPDVGDPRSTAILEFHSTYSWAIQASTLTANRAFNLPDFSGTLASVPSYVDLTAANAALASGDFFWDTTLKKLRVATA